MAEDIVPPLLHVLDRNSVTVGYARASEFISPEQAAAERSAAR